MNKINSAVPPEEVKPGSWLDPLSYALFKERIVLVAGEIEVNLATSVMFQLLLLAKEDPVTPITMYINSPGGDVQAGFTIIDTMEQIAPKVATVCYGLAASMGAVILAAGEKGMRSALPRAEVMIHQPWTDLPASKQSEIEISFRHITKTRQQTEEILFRNSNYQSIDEVHLACQDDNFLSAEQALKAGFIDKVLQPNELKIKA